MYTTTHGTAFGPRATRARSVSCLSGDGDGHAIRHRPVHFLPTIPAQPTAPAIESLPRPAEPTPAPDDAAPDAAGTAPAPEVAEPAGPESRRPSARGRTPGLRGRPPYGCRIGTALVDGQPQQCLVADERTAHIVQRVFREYLAEKGLQGIAEGLTADGIPSPGAAGRDSEHSTVAWSKSAVRAILVNGRYAGRNTSGAALPSPPIVEPELYDRVQAMFASRRTGTAAAAALSPRAYTLRGLVRCARCNRLMQGTWNNAEPYYRCRFPAEYASANGIDHPRNVYLREQAVLGPLTSWLRTTCSPTRLKQMAKSAGSGRHYEADVAAAAHHLRLLRESEGEARAAALQALGLRLTYSDNNRMLRVKAVLGPAHLVVRGSLAL